MIKVRLELMARQNIKIDFGPGYRVYYTQRVAKDARALGLRLHAQAA